MARGWRNTGSMHRLSPQHLLENFIPARVVARLPHRVIVMARNLHGWKHPLPRQPSAIFRDGNPNHLFPVRGERSGREARPVGIGDGVVRAVGYPPGALEGANPSISTFRPGTLGPNLRPWPSTRSRRGPNSAASASLSRESVSRLKLCSLQIADYARKHNLRHTQVH